MPSKFLCGCNVYGEDLTQPLEEDDEGFVVCPQHLQRRYGWRGTSSHGRPGASLLPRPGWSSLEQERYELYKTIPDRPATELHESDPEIEDRAFTLRHVIPLQAEAELRERLVKPVSWGEMKESFPSDSR